MYPRSRASSEERGLPGQWMASPHLSAYALGLIIMYERCQCKGMDAETVAFFCDINELQKGVPKYAQ